MDQFLSKGEKNVSIYMLMISVHFLIESTLQSQLNIKFKYFLLIVTNIK